MKTRFLLAAASMALAAGAHAATFNVANNGVDSATCGAAATPCRSISQAIVRAAAGDEILVGPGRYGDLNGNGILAEPGEETGASGCNCMIAVSKMLIIRSTHGATATMLDARAVNVTQNVLITSTGGEFGRPGQGFAVTGTSGTAQFAPIGFDINGSDVAVRGNQVIGKFQDKGIGINTECTTSVARIEDNQVMGWNIGIQPQCAGKIVARNALEFNTWGVLAFTDQPVADNVALGNTTSGIHATGGSASHNIAAGNGAGFSASFAGLLSANLALGNTTGIDAFSGSGPVNGNNIFGNQCGLRNEGLNTLNATNNYWGAATGPGADPADNVCSGAANTSPFAATPFAVPNPLPGPSVYRINTGGAAFSGTGSHQWTADSYFNTGTVITTTNTIAGTSDDVLYQSARTDAAGAPELKYSLALANGAYTVRLHFAEIVLTAAGQRLFNVKIQNATVLTNFDIFMAAGQANKAVIKTFTATVSNGALTIEFIHGVNNPIISAIEVVPQ
jgi:hypothetical protein